MAKKVWKVSEESKAGIELQDESITASVVNSLYFFIIPPF